MYFIEYICIYYVFIQEQVVHHVVNFQGDTAYELTNIYITTTSML